jgi:hypothetical protein
MLARLHPCTLLLGRRLSLACLLARSLARPPAQGPAMRRARRVVVLGSLGSLGRMMELSRKKRRWPALTESHGPSIAQHLVQHQETPCFPPNTVIITT